MKLRLALALVRAVRFIIFLFAVANISFGGSPQLPHTQCFCRISCIVPPQLTRTSYYRSYLATH
jgi:hypothetical protein